MKKAYEAPLLEIEHYTLDQSIASNCGVVIDMGPEGPGAVKVCKSYYDAVDQDYPAGITLFSLPKNVNFWDNCDCYTSANGQFFTS